MKHDRPKATGKHRRKKRENLKKNLEIKKKKGERPRKRNSLARGEYLALGPSGGPEKKKILYTVAGNMERKRGKRSTKKTGEQKKGK